jgi:inorganic pyrophosphatase
MTSYLDLPIGDGTPELITAVIEIPQGGINKYEYDKKLHVFRLDRNLHSPVHYPGDYGFIPQTVAEDGDPLDILVLGDAPTFPGCVYQARVIGLFEMLDQGFAMKRFLLAPRGTRASRISRTRPRSSRTSCLKSHTSSRFTRTSRVSAPRPSGGRIGVAPIKSSRLRITVIDRSTLRPKDALRKIEANPQCKDRVTGLNSTKNT